MARSGHASTFAGCISRGLLDSLMCPMAESGPPNDGIFGDFGSATFPSRLQSHRISSGCLLGVDSDSFETCLMDLPSDMQLARSDCAPGFSLVSHEAQQSYLFAPHTRMPYTYTRITQSRDLSLCLRRTIAIGSPQAEIYYKQVSG